MPSERPVVPTLAFKEAAAWAAWLEENHAHCSGVWVRLGKKASRVPLLAHREALELALCYGWIDAQKKPESDVAWLQKFNPRAKKSIWSKINREKALALIESGRMKPAGLREVERAKEDGRWQAAYDSPSTAAVPPDLQEALDANAGAAEFFKKLDRQNRYAILFRIQTAKKAETRAQRIQKFVQMLEQEKKIHP